MKPPIRRRWAWPLVVLLGVALASGCAGSIPSPFEEGVGSPQGREINVWVQNQQRNAVEVTLLGVGGQRLPLGRIDAGRSGMFPIQWRGGLIRAQCQIVGGGRFTTPAITLTSEATVFVTVATRLRSSSIRVR